MGRNTMAGCATDTAAPSPCQSQESLFWLCDDNLEFAKTILFLKSERAILGAHVFAPPKLRSEPCSVKFIKMISKLHIN